MGRIPRLEETDVRNKRVLTRVDFNVPVRDGEIVDDRRMVAALPTLRYLRDGGAKAIVVTHFGRPKGKIAPELSTRPLADHLSSLLKSPVSWCSSVAGDSARDAVAAMQAGDVLMLENVRFDPGEEANDPEFAQKLASLADLWCMDAFGAAHRAHASTEGVGHLIPGVAGFLMSREVQVLGDLFDDPMHPLIAVIGGAKISSKIGVLETLLKIVDTIWIGGAMACTFLLARGLSTGTSLVEEDQVSVARRLLLGEHGAKIRLPLDAVISDRADVAGDTAVVAVDAIPGDRMVVDIGPQTVALIGDTFKEAATVVWNGPLGVYEIEEYSGGTRAVARELAQSKAKSIIGGGDLAAAVDDAGVSADITHVSTGGGATLEFLEGKKLPGIAVLEDQGVRAR